jgi:hypothetical protein
MMAGIVLAHRASLATRNTTYFDDLSTPLVNPWHINVPKVFDMRLALISSI